MDLGWSGISYFLEMRGNISCKRASRKISYINSGIRKSSSITFDCCWLIRFEAEEYDTCSNIDPVFITAVCGIYSNTCDPSYVN